MSSTQYTSPSSPRASWPPRRAPRRAKAERRAWQRYHRAARNLQAADDALRAVGWGGPLDLAEIKRAVAASTPEAIQKQKDSVAWIEHLYPGTRQQCAVETAHELLKRYRPYDIVTTRGGAWWRLSAILFRDPEADLFRYLRDFRKYGVGKDIPPRISF